MASAVPDRHEGAARALAAEALGTSLLLAAVVGSGIMAENLTDDAAVQLLCNTLATAATLFVIIVIFAPVSGAHFNPAVTLVSVLSGSKPAAIGTAYVTAQILGAVAGVWLAHAMFGEAVFAWGVKPRTGASQWLSEAVATFGLVLTIGGTAGRSRETVAAAVALYIAGAYWFTASTSFANPAVTIARSLTPTFSGIAPWDAPAFIAAQLAGAAAALTCSRLVFRGPEPDRGE
jgi:glycerol uptake facilitator-like aquaporin